MATDNSHTHTRLRNCFCHHVRNQKTLPCHKGDPLPNVPDGHSVCRYAVNTCSLRRPASALASTSPILQAVRSDGVSLLEETQPRPSSAHSGSPRDASKGFRPVRCVIGLAGRFRMLSHNHPPQSLESRDTSNSTIFPLRTSKQKSLLC